MQHIIRGVIIGGIVLTAFSACHNNEFTTTPEGLKYKIFRHGESGKKVDKGMVLTMQMTYKNEADSLLFDSRKEPFPLKFMLGSSPFNGSFEQGLTLLSEGDSAAFIVSADSLFKHVFRSPMPPMIKTGSGIRFDISILKVQTREEVEKQIADEERTKMQEEQEAIGGYMREKKITVRANPSGLYFIETTSGKGEKADTAKTVVVNYTGKFLDGKIFDASAPGHPIEIVLGRGQVIQGWEEGLAMMHAGGKATLIIPSALAYGAHGAGKVIAPYTPLVFDVELVSVKTR